MSITYYLTHNMAVRVLSIIMVVMMLMACAFVPSADAVAEVIGLPLIASILSAFGVTSVATGTVDSMLNGLDQIMGEFSESLSHTQDWFRSLFDNDTFIASYGRLGITGTLVDSIKLFISWLRADKGLTSDTPLELGGDTFPTIIVDGVALPYLSGTINTSGSYLSLSVDAAPLNVSSNLSWVFPDYTYSIIKDPNPPGTTWIINPGNFYVRYEPIYYGFAVFNGYLYLFRGTRLNTLTSYYSNYHRVSSSVVVPPSDGWVINDDNLDLDYLENEDGSTKDVIFAPSFPDVRNPDLSTLDKWNDVAREQLDQSKTLTGEGEVTGEISTTVDYEPGSGGAGNVPPIVIPSHGWFRSIWHYVVKALQDSAEGIAFIVRLMQETIPPEILNLCWASAVLLITFGIINKFLK